MYCIQTILTIMLCYWLFIAAETKYELQIILVGTLAAFFDWNEWTRDPYFFSITTVMTVACVGQLMYKIYQEHGIPTMNHTMMEWFCWIHSIGYNVIILMMSVFICTMIQAIPEAFCIKFNGIFYEIAKLCRLVPPHTDGFTLITLTKTEREVSTYKLSCRLFHVMYLLVCLCILFYCRYLLYKTSLYPVVKALSYINLMMMGYFSLSVLNQLYVLYVRSDIVELHKKNNMDNEVDTATISLNLVEQLTENKYSKDIQTWVRTLWR